MNLRSICISLAPLAAFVLCGSVALNQPASAQQTPSAPAATAPAPPAAPIERHPMGPGMRSGMHQDMRPSRRPKMMGPARGNFQAHTMMHGRDSFRGEQRPGNGFHIGPEGMWWKNPMIVQRLSLTAEQTKKMDGIFQDSRIQLIDLRADVEKQEVMLEPLLSANPLDTAKAQAQIDKVADARADLEKADAKMLLGIRGVLTPEQWTKLRERRFGDPGAQPGAPADPEGRTRGLRGGSSAGSSRNLVEPPPQP